MTSPSGASSLSNTNKLDRPIPYHCMKCNIPTITINELYFKLNEKENTCD